METEEFPDLPARMLTSSDCSSEWRKKEARMSERRPSISCEGAAIFLFPEERQGAIIEERESRSSLPYYVPSKVPLYRLPCLFSGEISISHYRG